MSFLKYFITGLLLLTVFLASSAAKAKITSSYGYKKMRTPTNWKLVKCPHITQLLILIYQLVPMFIDFPICSRRRIEKQSKYQGK